MAIFSSTTKTSTWRRWVYDQIQTLLGSAGINLGTKTAEDGDLSSRIVVDPTNPDHDWYFSRGVQWVSPNWELAVTGDSPTGIFFNGDGTTNGVAVLAAGNHKSEAAGTTIADPENFACAIRLSGSSGIARINTNGTTRLSVSDTETVIDDLRISTNGYLRTSAGVAANSPLRVPHGSAPTSPVNGDIWTTTGGVFARVNGVTQQLSPGAGRWVLLEETAITAISNLDVTWDETSYDKILVVIEDAVSNTDNVDINLQFGSAGGTSFESSANYTTVYNAALSTWTQNASATSWLLTGAGNLGNSAGPPQEYFSCHVELTNYATSNLPCTIEGRSLYHNTLGNILDTKFFGSHRANSVAVDALRFTPSSGTWAATGTIRVYGLTNS